MPPRFTKLLADRLATRAKVRVAEGRSHQRIEAGCAWVAPGDFHMAVERSGDSVRLVTHQEEPENSCRPAADVLFRSIAGVYGPHALAAVMTGMGQDGLRGCEQIQAAGGQVLVQDEGSSVVWGMPGFVARAGMANGIVPLSRLSEEIYLDLDARRAILDRARRLLHARGYLLLGGSETTTTLDDSFDPVTLDGAVCFQHRQTTLT